MSYSSQDSNDDDNIWVGIVGVIVASCFWGSNFIVCKGYTGIPSNGVHFAFLMSSGILLVGFVTLFFSPTARGDFVVVLAPLGLLGGAIWAAGNCLTVPIIWHLGLGVGLSTWVAVNMIVAFIVGALGLEGIGLNLPPEELTRPEQCASEVEKGCEIVIRKCCDGLASYVRDRGDSARLSAVAECADVLLERMSDVVREVGYLTNNAEAEQVESSSAPESDKAAKG